jgi:MinD superfamily P-loop ATPase
VINKHDVNPKVAEQIEKVSTQKHVSLLGRIPYDPQVIRSMVQQRCVVEDDNSTANEAFRKIWDALERTLVS